MKWLCILLFISIFMFEIDESKDILKLQIINSYALTLDDIQASKNQYDTLKRKLSKIKHYKADNQEVDWGDWYQWAKGRFGYGVASLYFMLEYEPFLKDHQIYRRPFPKLPKCME